MNDFIELKLRIQPFDPWSDVLSQNLADIGFESFTSEDPFLLAYISSDLFRFDDVIQILNLYGDTVKFEIETSVIKAKNWNEEWESNFNPVVIEDKIYIRAPFHEDRPDIPIEIKLTPKMSFGTGHHATTHMMLLEMLNLDFIDKKVLDVGSGTAVLAILAEKLGANGILAIDNDDWAVMNGKENQEINNCHKIIVEKAEVQSVAKNGYNVILANINRNVILNDLSKYSELLSAGGHLLLSGFHHGEADELLALGRKFDLSEVNRKVMGEWCMLHLIVASS